MPQLTNNKYALITEVNPDSPISESYRSLRTNIRFASLEQSVKVILITSAKSEEGKSETAANLAVTYALEQKRVLLIDANLRKPSLHHYFSTSNRLGLTDVITGQNQLKDVLSDTHIPNVSLIASGSLPMNPSELLASKRMYALLSELKEKFDVILVDSSPILSVTDSQVLSAMCDGVVLVVNSGKVKRDEAKQSLARLEYVKARVLGVVLNNYKGKKNNLA
jgi:capsular exopolysaccharide synthesis family protein